MTIHNIIILTSSPLSKRDYDRFGIEILQKHFDVTVLDCTPWLKPQVWEKCSEIRYPFSQYNTVRSWDEFQRAFARLDKGLVIDYLGHSRFSMHIYQMFRDRDILRAIVYNSALPIQHLTILQRLHVLYRGGGLFRKISTQLCHKIRSGLNETIPADIAVLSGEESLKDPRAQTKYKIRAHSFDYDLYLSLCVQKRECLKPYAVFLDMDLAYHSDFVYDDIKPHVTAEKYYPALLAFFDIFERITGINVIFAAHPRSRYDLRPHLLSGRIPVLGRTAELVRDANIVLSHGSTSTSFAIMWRKPIIFLTSNELKRSLIGFIVDSFRHLSNAPLINIDSLNELNIDLKAWTNVDESAYVDYQKRYIKIPGTPEKPVWEIFSDYVQEEIK